mmetsp:Transcript_115739/g.321802  ORF Transcript_115739/g.321802 Transcript_115739/m.321802 type:complete len:134 (-) Transcript_115739:715-1116(-)
MAKPADARKIVKKRVKKFPRFQADQFKRMNPAWRKPRGIDGCVRRRFRGEIRMPKIGYGTNKKTRHLLPNGFYKFTVKSERDLDMLLMQNRKYCAEIAHGVSKRTRASIVERAAALNVRLTNPHAKLREEEAE